MPVIKKLLRTKTGLAILALVVVAYLGGFLDMASLTGGGGKRLVDEQADNEQAAFIKTVLADTEAVWSKVFAQAGARYPAPVLVLYRGSTVSGWWARQCPHGAVLLPGRPQGVRRPWLLR